MWRTTKLRVLPLLLLLLLLKKKLLEMPLMLTSYSRQLVLPQVWLPYLPLCTSQKAIDLVRAPEINRKLIKLRLMMLLLVLVLDLMFKQERLVLRCVLMIWL